MYTSSPHHALLLHVFVFLCGSGTLGRNVCMGFLLVLDTTLAFDGLLDIDENDQDIDPQEPNKVSGMEKCEPLIWLPCNLFHLQCDVFQKQKGLQHIQSFIPLQQNFRPNNQMS